MSNTSAMKLWWILFTVGAVAAASLAAVALLRTGPSTVPRIGPDVEQICLDTMRRAAPDRSWVAPRHEQRADLNVPFVTLGELRGHDRQLVRVAGVLHAEFEHVALYTSRAAMDADYRGAPWVNLERLAIGEDLLTLRPAVSDRCVVVEAIYERGKLGHFGMFDGSLDAVKLEVWSTPHRPLTRP